MGGSSSSSSGSGGSSNCINETKQSCYGGLAGTQGVGVCHEGTQTCAGGDWGPCVDEVTSSAETCDGLDNNCDGAVDDGLSTLSCGAGQCALTAPACVNGQAQTCTPGAPSPEICDGLDNNCDGAVDDGCSPASQASYLTAPGYFDAVLDTERHQVFLSYGGSGVVHVIGLVGGSDKVVKTGWKAEFMHFDSILDQVVISLPSGTHSSYWWDEDQEGYVGAISAISLADPTPIWIPLDPWQIVSDGTGTVYAAGASGQWTSAIAVNLQTGWSALSGGSASPGRISRRWRGTTTSRKRSDKSWPRCASHSGRKSCRL